MIPILYDCEEYDAPIDSLPSVAFWGKVMACVYSLAAVGIAIWVVW